MNSNGRSKVIFRFVFHMFVLILGFVVGFLFIGKGIKMDFFTKNNNTNETKQEEVVNKEVSSEFIEVQLLQDLKDKVISMDEYLKNMLFAEYDQEYLSTRYYSLKRPEYSYDTDFIAYTYESKITDTTMKYYLDRAILSGVTFDLNKENVKKETGDIVAFAGIDKVNAADFNKNINLNKVVLSGNGNFVIWYTTTGDSAITEQQAKSIADSLEYARYDYDKLYNRYFDYRAEFYNNGSVINAQTEVYQRYGIDPKYLKQAMQVYLVNYTETSSAKYIVAGDKLTNIYNKFKEGDITGTIPGPYLIIKASDYNKSKERTMQIANRELFRYYQYNVYCPDADCIINDDPYYYDATASYASSIATEKYTYRGLLNEYAAFAREHASDLLSDPLIAKYGDRNIGNSLYLFLNYYAEIVPDGSKRIIDAIYQEKPFEYLEKKAGNKSLAEIQELLALEHLKQNNKNANLIASPDVSSNLTASQTFDGTSNVNQQVIEKFGVHYYILNVHDHEYTIELGRNNANIICLLVGVKDGNYTLLSKASVSDINVQFNTANYKTETGGRYSQFYIIIGNSSIVNRNVFSLDLIEY